MSNAILLKAKVLKDLKKLYISWYKIGS